MKFILLLLTGIMMISASSVSSVTRTALKNSGRQFTWQTTRRSVSSFRAGARSSSMLSLGRVVALTGVVSTAAIMTSLHHSTTSTDCAAAGAGKPKVGFYPSIKPYETGLLQVSDLHSIAYSVYGNPNGKPVLVVHGGPGGGTTPDMARYFDPAVYRIILVDQRGCGKSLPFAELKDNTTYDSVRDFEKIRKKLGIERWQVFGGSWGSTLSLAYAVEHPERVTELVLRGIFLLREKELKWMYQGPGGSFMFPEDWEKYEEAIPPAERGDFMTAYGKRLRGEMGKEEMFKASKAWSLWEGRISKLVQDPPEKLNSKFGEDQFALAFARIENHYFLNKGFFPRDGYLLEEAQLKKIRHIPTFIVQGRYDLVCPPVSAHELYKGLSNGGKNKNVELVYTLSGHSGGEETIIEQLVMATDRFKSRK